MGSYRRIGLGLFMVMCEAAITATALPQTPQEAPPVFRSDIALVAVPVFVTDKSGQAVAGLTAADFEVEDGGRRVPIAAFHAVDVDADAGVASGPAPELPVAVQAAARRQFLLLFDLAFSPPQGLKRARSAAVRFVRDSLGPSDLVAIATYSSSGFRMLTNFTSDREHVVRAIETLGLLGGFESDPLGLGGETSASGGGAGPGASLAAEAEAAIEGLLQQALKRAYVQKVSDFLADLEELAQALAPLRGRNQLVLLSAGFLGKAWIPEKSGLVEQPLDLDVRERMDRLFQTAGRSDVVIHSVNLAGLEGPVDVASRTGQQIGRGGGIDALAALATNTGGRYIRPTNDFGLALGEVERVSRRYYLVAFQPDPASGEKPRKLKVRVRRPGLSVSHRPAYVVTAAPTTSSPGGDMASARLTAAEAIGKGLSGGPLGLQLTAVPYRDREGRPTLPVVLHIDPADLWNVARGDRLELQVYGYALAEGRVLDSFSLETGLDLTKVGTSLRAQGVRVLTTFAVAPGSVELRFFVRAGAAATGSIRRQVVTPEGATSAPIAVLPLPGKLVFPLSTTKGPALEIPFRLGTTAFVPGPVVLQAGRASEL
jgi:VWFA-related protein